MLATYSIKIIKSQLIIFLKLSSNELQISRYEGLICVFGIYLMNKLALGYAAISR